MLRCRNLPGRIPGGLVAWALAVPALVCADEEVVHQSAFDVRAGGTLRIDVVDIDLELRPTTTDRVLVEVVLQSRDMEWARERFERMKFTTDGSDKLVTIRAREPRMDWKQWRHGMTLTAKVQIPEKFNLDLETSDGDILVERVDGNVEIQTSDGNIDLRSIRAGRLFIDTSDGDVRIGELNSPEIQIETSDGNIRIDTVEGDEIDLRTSDGDIDIEAVSGGLNASTSDGGINIGLERLASTSLRTHDGDIRILASEDLRANLDLSGDDVSIRRGSLSFEGELSERFAQGKLNGGGPRLRATTGGGRIVLTSR